MRWMIAAAALLVAPAGALAQTPKPAECAAIDKTLPESFAGWTSKQPLVSAADAKLAASATLAPGAAVDVTLKPAAIFVPVSKPGRAKAAAGFGGLLALEIAEAGTYRLAAGSAAWVDVVRDGETLNTVGHGHGPQCSTIRKFVDFPLKPGRYLVQVSDSETDHVALLVSRLP